MKHLNLILIAVLLSINSFAQAPAPISGPTSFCVGSSTTFSDATSGGVWTSSLACASIGSITGVVTGLCAGTGVITYTTSGGSATTTITINPAPSAIAGPSSMCDGTAITLTDTSPGGTWSTGMPTVATVGVSSGIVTATSAGVTAVTYTLPATGCFATHPLTVNTSPGAITGPSSVCIGSSVTISDPITGGIWSSSTTAVGTIDATTGAFTGIAAGTATIDYALSTGCGATKVVTVAPLPASYTVTGGGSYCAGGSGVPIGLSGSTLGATYDLYVGGTVIGSPVTGTGSAISFGSMTIPGLYVVTATSGCTAAMSGSVTVSVNPLPAAYTVTGGGTYCSGGVGLHIFCSASTVGIAYQLYLGTTPVGTPISGAGSVVDFGLVTSPGTYGVIATNLITGCVNTMTGSATIAIDTPSVSITTASGGCGGTTALTASGAATYSWSPSAGLSCSTCATTDALPSSTTTYSVTGTDGTGCTATATTLVDGNRIGGHITYSGSATDTFKVWLVQFNPSDSSITALDSTFSCMDGSVPYYQFMDPVPGSYMVKAKLLGTTAGSSGYIPTYSLSTPHWDSAATVTHTTTADSLHINMVYGTVPSGPGFISGFVVSGAGKGTSGDVPAPGMLIYLKDASGHILTYTYTNSSGNYSFTGLGYGSYLIYPENYKYYTTPSAPIMLSATSSSATAINFKEHTSYGTITPYTSTVTPVHAQSVSGIKVYPNPAQNTVSIAWAPDTKGNVIITVTDLAGRTDLQTIIDANTGLQETNLNLSALTDGIYIITVKADNINYTGKLQLVK